MTNFGSKSVIFKRPYMSFIAIFKFALQMTFRMIFRCDFERDLEMILDDLDCDLDLGW